MKPLILWGGLIAAIVVAIYLLRSLLYVMGYRAMGSRSYGTASIVFSVLGILFVSEKGRIYQKYCRFKKGKLTREEARQAVEVSKMAYSSEGYQLLQRIERSTVTPTK